MPQAIVSLTADVTTARAARVNRGSIDHPLDVVGSIALPPTAPPKAGTARRACSMGQHQPPGSMRQFLGGILHACSLHNRRQNALRKPSASVTRAATFALSPHHLFYSVNGHGTQDARVFRSSGEPFQSNR